MQNPIGMPLDPHIKVVPNPEANEPNGSNAFSQCLGELQFLGNMTRLDILYPVNWLGASTANPSLQHYAALKQMLRYLSGTRTFGITYRRSKDDTDKSKLFYGFSDAAFVNQDNGKSTSGYVFLASRGAITWKSEKQSIIALSRTESEYIALSEATWLRNLYGKLGFPQMTPMIIKGNNEGSVSMTHDPQFHARSKHIVLHHHWVRDLINDNVLDIHNVCNPEQMADILTEEMGVRATDIIW